MTRMACLTAWLIFAISSVAHAKQLDLEFEFASGSHGWIAGFSDYPQGQEPSYELRSGLEQLPANLGRRQTAFMLSGNNHSDDLFMFLKRAVDGLKPNRVYELSFSITFATNAGTHCTGIGGAPGESVFVKLAATDREPSAVAQNGDYRMNIDIGHQGASGRDAVVIGNIANGDTACSKEYRFKTLSHRALQAKADEHGRVWVLIGTDSGFEGTTTLYYSNVRITLRSIQ